MSAGIATSFLSGGNAALGDARYFVETQGLDFAIEKLGQVIADGRVDIDANNTAQLIDCGCYR